jgi:hypothetical protein
MTNSAVLAAIVAVLQAPVDFQEAAPSPEPAGGGSWLLILVVVVAVGACLVAIGMWKARQGASTRHTDRGYREPSPPAESTPPLRAPAPASFRPPPPGSRTKVFVSYRRDDSPYVAGRVFDSLQQRFGPGAVSRDVDSFPLGVDFRRSIDHAVSDATVVLVVVGRKWFGPESTAERRIDSSADFIRIEIAAALARGIPVVPLLVDGAVMPEATTLPEDIRDFAYRNAVSIRPDPDFANDVDRLIRGILNLENLPKQGTQENLPKQGTQENLPEQGTQENLPKQET